MDYPTEKTEQERVTYDKERPPINKSKLRDQKENLSRVPESPISQSPGDFSQMKASVHSRMFEAVPTKNEFEDEVEMPSDDEAG
jgi:hypothetical protein